MPPLMPSNRQSNGTYFHSNDKFLLISCYSQVHKTTIHTINKKLLNIAQQVKIFLFLEIPRRRHKFVPFTNKCCFIVNSHQYQ